MIPLTSANSGLWTWCCGELALLTSVLCLLWRNSHRQKMKYSVKEWENIDSSTVLFRVFLFSAALYLHFTPLRRQILYFLLTTLVKTNYLLVTCYLADYTLIDPTISRANQSTHSVRYIYGILDDSVQTGTSEHQGGVGVIAYRTITLQRSKELAG